MSSISEDKELFTPGDPGLETTAAHQGPLERTLDHLDHFEQPDDVQYLSVHVERRRLTLGPSL